MTQSRFNNDSRGFSLVEMAIVMVIVGMLLSMGLGMLGPITAMGKKREIRDSLDTTLSSIASWAASHNRIPRFISPFTAPPPANPDNEFEEIAKSMNDPWGQRIVYLYDANLAPLPAAATKDTICGRRTTSLTLVTANPATTINNVAYMVLSGGEEGRFQASLNGTLVPLPGNPGTLTTSPVTSSSGPATGMVTIDPVPGNQDNFTDVVRWITIDDLRQKVGCQGAQLKVLNNELPSGTSSGYSVTISADGGVPFAVPPNSFRWCVNTLPTTGLSIVGGVQNANCWNLAEAAWGAASPTLTIQKSALPLPSGAYPVTVVVRDFQDGSATSNACSDAAPGDNCATKNFVITINP